MAAEEETDVQIKPEFQAPHLNKESEGSGMNNWHGTRQVRCAPHLCTSIIQNEECTRPNCKHMHILEEYLAEREPLLPEICPLYANYGRCPFAYNCRLQHPNEVSADNFRNPAFSEVIKLPNEILEAFLGPHVLRELRSGEFDIPSPVGPKFELKPGSLMLAPMCSVGTLPFRRLCKDYGADVTFSEMIIAREVLQGNMEELKKMRRGECEDVYGIQLTGTPNEIFKLANMIEAKNLADFVDVNAACPQEVATRYECGFAIAERRGRINAILRRLEETGVNASLKTRIGDFHGDDIQDRILQEISGIANLRCICIHGRTAKQRYARTADWVKIADFRQKLKSNCACCDENVKNVLNSDYTGNDDLIAANPSEKVDTEANNVVMIGNGDIFTPSDAKLALNAADCIMIGRGALVKPWIFKEIKEGKEIDMSSHDRLQMCKKFASYCLEMYGTDDIGIERSRQQFLENWTWMSRYVPVGLRAGPEALNLRTPSFKGRDDLETLMGSQQAVDWVKISEMLFGAVPKGFCYQPKHKSKGSYAKADNV